MLKVRILGWERYFRLSDGPNVILKVVVRVKQESQSRRRRCDPGIMGQRVRERDLKMPAVGFDDGGHVKLLKRQTKDSPLRASRRIQSCRRLDFRPIRDPKQTRFGLLTSRTVKLSMCGVEAIPFVVICRGSRRNPIPTALDPYLSGSFLLFKTHHVTS